MHSFIYFLSQIYIEICLILRGINPPPNSLLHWSTLTASTASGLLGNICNSMAHPDLGFPPSLPSHILSGSIELDWGAFVSSYLQVIPQILSRKSGFWPETLKDFHTIVWSLSRFNLAQGQCSDLQHHPDVCECVSTHNSISNCICFLLSHV